MPRYKVTVPFVVDADNEHEAAREVERQVADEREGGVPYSMDIWGASAMEVPNDGD